MVLLQCFEMKIDYGDEGEAKQSIRDEGAERQFENYVRKLGDLRNGNI